jgi:hypothetical protein
MFLSILRYHIKSSNEISTPTKYILLYQLNRKIFYLNRSELTYSFASEYNRDINDELNRSFRVLSMSLNDYFGDNIMQRDIENVIKEYYIFIQRYIYRCK